jgi:hypothetical protein
MKLINYKSYANKQYITSSCFFRSNPTDIAGGSQSLGSGVGIAFPASLGCPGGDCSKPIAMSATTFDKNVLVCVWY